MGFYPVKGMVFNTQDMFKMHVFELNMELKEHAAQDLMNEAFTLNDVFAVRFAMGNSTSDIIFFMGVDEDATLIAIDWFARILERDSELTEEDYAFYNRILKYMKAFPKDDSELYDSFDERRAKGHVYI